jgi:rare lipoprotein A (peptidoglycan hydrolase)
MNDRGPSIHSRKIDLSKQVAQQLGWFTMEPRNGSAGGKRRDAIRRRAKPHGRNAPAIVGVFAPSQAASLSRAGAQ